MRSGVTCITRKLQRRFRIVEPSAMMYVQHTATLSERDETELLLATRIGHNCH